MKPESIEQFAHLSQFESVEQFTHSIKVALSKHPDAFTKGEQLALRVLTRFSVKTIGVCNARICKLVQECQ